MNDLDTAMERLREMKAIDFGPTDIDTAIAYYRRLRARKEKGEKIGVKAEVSVAELLIGTKPKEKYTIGRRI